jgi:iron complex outermembrane receptor protein
MRNITIVVVLCVLGSASPLGGTAFGAPVPVDSIASPFRTVITAAEIEAHGYHTLGEALRWVRGFYVADDHTYEYVGARGVQRPGDYNARVAILIDGHAITGSVYGDGYLGAELGLDMERVEQIEVTHGPGGAEYVGHALLAVVNVVTRKPTRNLGFDVAAWTGGPSIRRGAAAVESAQPDRPSFVLGGSWQDAHGLALSDDASQSALDGEPAGERNVALLGRMNWAGTSLALKLNERMKPTSDNPEDRAYDGHDFVELAHVHSAGPVSLHARGWWDGSRYRAFTASADSVPVTSVDSGVGDVFGAEWRMDWTQSARSTFTAGIEGEYHARTHLFNYDEAPYSVHQDENGSRRLAAFYVQNDRGLGGGVRAVAGLRLDATSDFDPIASPRLDLWWTDPAIATVRLAAGSTSRVPTIYEIVNADPASTLTPEHLVTVEGSVAHTAGPFVAMVTGYHNHLRGLMDLATLDSTGATGYVNLGRVDANGVEGELQGGWDAHQARLGVGYQIARNRDTGAELTASPRWNVHLVADHRTPGSRVSVGYGLRWLSPRAIGDGTRTSAAVVADARLGVNVRPWTSIGLEAKNLFNAHYGDPIDHDPIRGDVPQDSRAWYLTMKYRVGGLP